ncbi:MAG: hypothetical protein ACREAD_01795 [Nitrosopumilaceae archaeon]
MSSIDFCSIAPIPNLYIELDSPLNVKDIRLIPHLNDEQLKQQFSIELDIMNYVERENWVSSPIYVRNITVTGSAPGSEAETAFQLASKQIEDFINTLILFKPSMTYLARGPFWVHQIVDGNVTGTGKGDFATVPKFGPAERYQLCKSEYLEFVKFYEIWNSYMSNNSKTNLDLSISNSYHWLTKARMNLMPYDRLIFLITALESLVGAGTELTHRISHRTATILGSDSVERGKIYDRISEYYGQRSTLLHGSITDISNNMIFDLAEMVRAMILRFTSLSLNTYTITRKDLMEKLDRSVVDETLRDTIIQIGNKSFGIHSNPQLV